MRIAKLRIFNLSHVYSDADSDHGLLALNNLSLEIMRGEFAAVIGPSGCGKTTLLNIIAGLIKPTRGAVTVNGTSIQESTGMQTKVGMVFQNPLLLPWKTVLENVRWGLDLKGLSRSEANAKATEATRIVGLSGFEDYYPRSLSGGMQQRASLARALVLDSELLLMDEPFANLDAQSREMMGHELARIWEDTRKTILFVTHDTTEAVYLADRIYVLTRRPGTVKEIVSVDLPRPRTPATRRSPEFLQYERRVWELLELPGT